MFWVIILRTSDHHYGGTDGFRGSNEGSKLPRYQSLYSYIKSSMGRPNGLEKVWPRMITCSHDHLFCRTWRAHSAQRGSRLADNGRIHENGKGYRVSTRSSSGSKIAKSGARVAPELLMQSNVHVRKCSKVIMLATERSK